jgi:hypothetical protein
VTCFSHMNLLHGISNHKGWVPITCRFQWHSPIFLNFLPRVLYPDPLYSQILTKTSLSQLTSSFIKSIKINLDFAMIFFFFSSLLRWLLSDNLFINMIDLHIDLFSLESYVIIIIVLFEYNGSSILNNIACIVKSTSLIWFIKST